MPLMEPTGIRRKVDDLGRIVVPAGIRKALGIAEGDELDVALDGQRIVLTKATTSCAFCEDPPALAYRGKAVCATCLAALGALAREHATRRPPPPGTTGSSP